MADNIPRKRIRKVLIANRGEIAVRILRGLREMGIRGAVIYSEPDRLGLPVLLADEAYPIGPAPSRESYLRAEAIVELAVRIGADAIHPGYGFLSERAGFSRLCRDAGITFIGPSPEAIDAMGSKVESRRLMMARRGARRAGRQGPAARPRQRRRRRRDDRLPGDAQGRGRRRRQGDADDPLGRRAAERLPRRPLRGRRELRRRLVYLEKYIVDPRHVEIQVLGDHHGKVVSLGERECSLQRRHQKVVEEAPSSVVGPSCAAAWARPPSRPPPRWATATPAPASSCSTATGTSTSWR